MDALFRLNARRLPLGLERELLARLGGEKAELARVLLDEPSGAPLLALDLAEPVGKVEFGVLSQRLREPRAV